MKDHTRFGELLYESTNKTGEIYKLATKDLGKLWPVAQLRIMPKDQVLYRFRSLLLPPKCIGDLPVYNWHAVTVGEPKIWFKEAIIIHNEEMYLLRF